MRGVSKHAPALDAVGAHRRVPSTGSGQALRGRFAVPQDEVVGSYSCEPGLECARRMEPGLDCRPYGGGDVVFASIRVDDCAAQRLGRSDVEERWAGAFMTRR